MKTKTYGGLSMGDVPRFYETPLPIWKETGNTYVTSVEDINGERCRGVMPQHRKDDRVPYMRADEFGQLEVVADCDKHYVRLTQRELASARRVPCPKGCYV